MTNTDYRTRLYELAEEALANGMTQAEVRQAVEDGISSLEADREFALDEQGIDFYPHLAEGAS